MIATNNLETNLWFFIKKIILLICPCIIIILFDINKDVHFLGKKFDCKHMSHDLKVKCFKTLSGNNFDSQLIRLCKLSGLKKTSKSWYIQLHLKIYYECMGFNCKVLMATINWKPSFMKTLLILEMFIRFEKLLQNHQVTLRLFINFQLVKVDSKSLLFH
jgi:hypothetical protein